MARPAMTAARKANDAHLARPAVVELNPALWSLTFAREERNGDQHDPYSVAAWLSRADRDSSFATFLNPDLSPPERMLAQVEGWILGVPSLIRAGKGCDDSAKSPTCDPSVFRLR